MSCLQLGVRHTAVKSGGAPPEADAMSLCLQFAQLASLIYL